ncbi:MAG: undecaprenyldiphospho-muramoylpentapeptide beta-N-acetylglucosaminyltransferase [Clostridia bacterium]|nr:undecaprenyldiphospho-muramoylpentapeptide beta-N-acetylglucosaminyltransferase [Clostridia bacterium]
MRVLLTGGGTAGHINPALAIAETIRQNDPNAVIEFVGIKNGKESDLIPREGYRLHYVDSMGIRRSLSPANIKAAWLALTSPYAKKTVRILDDFQPDIVIGTGGYACWPIMAAAARRGIPTAVHESNALPGLAVRRLQSKVDRIWINFANTEQLLKEKDKILRVGNPLRGGFGALSKADARRRLGLREDQFLILSFGGSLGAEEVNAAVIRMMHSLVAGNPDLLHMHASGKRDYDNTKVQFFAAGLHSAENCVLSDYIYDMPLRMAAADLVISRAGAMTLSELALMKKACVLIPSPYVADNHQYKNAKALADAGAAVLIEESSLEKETLTEAVRDLLANAEKRKQMEQNIVCFADPDANKRIWQEILTLTKKSSG